MKKQKFYYSARFSPEVIQVASTVLERRADPDSPQTISLHLVVEVDNEEWTHDSEHEFFADYRRCTGIARYKKDINGSSLFLQFLKTATSVEVSAKERATIQEVFQVFEAHLSESLIAEPSTPAPKKPIVFIGHGRSSLWKELKDHLQDKHRYRAEAYEIGARAGHAIRDILEQMLSKASIAFLVMTGEDETSDGGMRARQNVIHEIGLFQGRLGFNRGIVLLEEGTEEFSNIHGIEQIRFRKGNIKETFGEVLATLRREFPEEAV
jgi:predicted nucleotide-binding protein